MITINPTLLPHDLDELYALHDSLGEQIDALIDRRAAVMEAIEELEADEASAKARELRREHHQSVL